MQQQWVALVVKVTIAQFIFYWSTVYITLTYLCQLSVTAHRPNSKTGAHVVLHLQAFAAETC